MCGIIGYVGEREATPILLDGLGALEYRGYDSAGIAVFERSTDRVTTVRSAGKLRCLMKKLAEHPPLLSNCGIGHTRWATHGEPTEENAHPHTSSDGVVTLVHNGIVENYRDLRARLSEEGYRCLSQTDTEVATNLIASFYRLKRDALGAIASAAEEMRGSFAMAVLFADLPDTVFLIRKDSPLIVGLGDDGVYAASDIPALLPNTRRVCYLDDMEMARLDPDGVHFYNLAREEIQKPSMVINWDATAARLGGYPHFMLKEIEEQPVAVEATVRHYLKNGRINLEALGLEKELLQSIERVYIVACGSAYHAGLVAARAIEALAKIPAEVELASEFRYRDPILSEKGLCVVISQSGETADSLAALRLAKARGIPTLGIVNVVGSSVAREADGIMPTLAGPEIAVATTKAYSAQLIAAYILALGLGVLRGAVNEEEEKKYAEELGALPKKIKELLSQKESFQCAAARLVSRDGIFYLGRGVDYASAMEGSLKLKEISYIHSEAYAAGELKHGTISLVEDGTVAVAVMTQEALFDKMASNIIEIKSRGAFVVAITAHDLGESEKLADLVLTLPQIHPIFTPSLSVIPMQLMAYFVGVSRGFDVDKPRNLAKSVTVE